MLGIVLVKLTGWLILDAIVASGVAINIIWTGYQLIRRLALGLLDTAIPESETNKINQILLILSQLKILHLCSTSASILNKNIKY